MQWELTSMGKKAAILQSPVKTSQYVSDTKEEPSQKFPVSSSNYNYNIGLLSIWKMKVLLSCVQLFVTPWTV